MTSSSDQKPPVDRTGHALTRSEEHTSELQSQSNLVCRLLLEKKELNAFRPFSRIFSTRLNIFTAPTSSPGVEASEVGHTSLIDSFDMLSPAYSAETNALSTR